jgi:hypothetical protein
MSQCHSNWEIAHDPGRQVSVECISLLDRGQVIRYVVKADPGRMRESRVQCQ